ncbi:MAG: TonB-dependent receptor plug domain-containing protein, partial [Sphingomonadales bacterium]
MPPKMKTSFLKISLFGLLSLTLIFVSENSIAQNQGKVRYDQHYFSQYQNISLEDMIRNIPGGTPIIYNLIRAAQRESNTRGFGANGTQILINGKRMSGKANDMAKNLTRIQASQVDYIELIRGNAEGLDIRNEGILINVILRKGTQETSSTYIDLRADYTPGTSLKPNGQIARNGQQGNFSYGFSYLRTERP